MKTNSNPNLKLSLIPFFMKPTFTSTSKLFASFLSIVLCMFLSISFVMATSNNAKAIAPKTTSSSKWQSTLDHAKDGQMIMLPAIVNEVLTVKSSVILMTSGSTVLKGLIMDAPGKKVKLLGDLTINGTLELGKGILDAGTYRIKANFTTAASANSYILLLPSGSLTMSVAPNTTVNFPIGTGMGLADVDVIGNPTHVTDNITMSVVDAANLAAFTDVDPVGPRFALFEWDATEAVAGGSNVNFIYHFPTDPSDVKNSKAVVGHNTAGTWSYVNTTITGSMPFQTSSVGPYTSFSPFGVFGSMPVHNITQMIDYATIQAAIDAANPNDIILCDAATYTEAINIHKAVTLRGANFGIPGIGGRAAEAILLNCTIDINNAGNTTIDGFHILRNDGNTGPTNQIELDGGGVNTVQNCIIERNGSNTGQAIRALATTTAGGNKIITNNKIFGDASGGLFSGHKSWNNGIYVDQGPFTVSITSNTILNCRSGLNIDDMNNSVTVSGNTINNNGTHISFGAAVPTTGSFVLGSNNFINNAASTMINLSNVNANFRLDITSSTLSGVAFSALTNAQLFDVEARMAHKEVSASKKGKVIYLTNKQYVNNFTAPFTKIDKIQNSINYGDVGDTIYLEDGTYNEKLIIDRSNLSIQGVTGNKTLYIIDGTALGTASGIVLNNGMTNITIKNLTVQKFTGASGNANAGIYGMGGNNNLKIDSVAILDNPTASGFYANGPVDNVIVTNSMVVNNGGGARGIVLWNGLKTNINFSNNMVTNNSCCGIELQDGNASAVTVSSNTIGIGGGDNAIGLTGLNPTIGNNLIQNNIITGGGRFGIEIKNPAGGVTVSGNSVTLTTVNADLRDRAGIAVFRRAVSSGNVNVPNGVTVTGNTVDGYVQTLPEEGFGIVIEGTNHTVTGNTIKNSNIGIQQQGGAHPNANYPAGDGDQAVGQSANYFGRGNAPFACGNTISGNTFVSNTTDTRNVLMNSYGLVTNTNTGLPYCNIQAAIDDALTLNGHVISVTADTFPEQITVNKQLDIRGPNYGIAGNGSRVAEATIVPPSELNLLGTPREWDTNPLITFNANNIKMDGFKISGDNPLINGYTYAGMNVEAGRGIKSIGNDITFKNNIVEKFTYIGFNSEGGLPTPTYNNLIVTKNKFDNIHDLNQLGYGFAIYAVATAGAINDNTFTNSRIGIQIQPYQVVQGSNGVSTCNNNSFSIWRQAVYYNYAEVGASAWTIDGNTITATAPPANPTGPVLWEGIRAETMRASSNGGTISNNNVNGSGATTDNVKWWGVWGLNYRGGSSTSTQVFFTSNTVSNVELGFVHSAAADIVLTGNNLSASNKAISIQRDYSSAGVIQPNGGINHIDATGGNTINGVASGGATTAQLYTIEDAINHKIDNATFGFATVKANHAYVTTNSFFTPNTSPSVQRGIDAVAANGTVRIQSGATYTGGADASSKTVTLASGASTACVTITGDMVLNGGDVLDIEVNGTTACTLHDQFIVNGMVTLGGATLNLSLGYSPANGDQIKIIDNDMADAVSGQFSQGTSITVGLYTFVINYAGGDGNDVVLEACVPPTITIVETDMSGVAPNDGIICNGASATLNATTAGAMSYLWSTMETTASITVMPSVTTPYTVTVTFFPGCSATQTSTITVNPLPSCTITGTNGPVCPNSINTFDGPGGLTYAWSISGNGTISGSSTMQTVTVTSGALCNNSYTLTLTTTDGNSCSSTCTKTVNVLDNTPPVVTTGTINACYTSQALAEAAALAATTATDGCPGTLTKTASTSGTCSATITITVTDACSNSATTTYTTRIDGTGPALTCPGNITINAATNLCGKNVHYTDPTATDNCSGAITITQTDMSGFINHDFFPVGVTIQSFQATDGCGNSTTCSFTVTVVDNQMPIITGCPSNIVKSTDPGLCTAITGWVAPTASDNCPGVIMTLTPNLPPGSAFPKGVTALQYKATDASGNMTTCNFTVTVNDNELPVITCPTNITMNTDAGLCSAVVSFAATATDNCPGVTIAYSQNPGTVFPLGTTTVVATATDASMNTKTCSFTITVVDNENPMITYCPANITVSCTSDTLVSNTNGPATATDNCSAVVTFRSNITAQTCANRYTLTRTWIATDASGNTATCTQVVTVNDQTKPVITPGTIAACYTSVALAEAAALAAASATDNCGGTITETVSTAGTTCDVVVTVTETDVCGNFETTTYNTRIDNTPPVITSGTIAACYPTVGDAEAAAKTATTAMDNCSGPITEAATTVGTCDAIITVTETDGCGNVSSTTYSTSIDNTAPTVVGPVNKTIEGCNTSALPQIPKQIQVGPAQAPQTYYPDRYPPFAFDTSSFMGGVRIKHEINAADCQTCRPAPYQSTFYNTQGRKYDIGNALSIAIDLYIPASWATTGRRMAGMWGTSFNVGNSVEAYPIIEFSSDGGVPRFRGWDNNTGLWVDMGLPSGFSYNSWQTLVIRLVGDKFLYKVGDLELKTEAFASTYIGDIILQGHNTASPGVTYDIYWENYRTLGINLPYNTSTTSISESQFFAEGGSDTDNCADLSFTYKDVSSGSCPILVTRTFTVTDGCGNSTTKSQVITIQDVTPPVITCPSNKTQNTDAGLCTAVVNGIAPVTQSDNCSILSVVYAISGATIGSGSNDASGTIFNKGLSTVIYTITDMCSNTSSCSFTVTINDNIPPSVSCVAPQTRGTDAPACTYTAVGAEFNPTSSSDNCAVTSTTYELTGVTTGSGSTTLAGVVFNKGVTTVTWTVSDAAGNTASCSFTVTVNDDDAPTITCPPSQTQFLDANCKTNMLDYTGLAIANDNCPMYVVTQSPAMGTMFTGEQTVVVTLTVTDMSNNTATCNFNVLLEDNTPPSITCPANATLNAVTGACEQTHSWTIPTPTDNCGIASLTVSSSNNTVNIINAPPIAFAIFPVGVTTVTYLVTDINGNTNSCSFTVTIVDNQDPIITGCPGNIGPLGNDPGLCGRVVTWNEPTASDNCPGVTLATTPPNANGSVFPVGAPTMVTYIATDASGRTSTCSFTVTIIDTEAPAITCPGNIVQSNDAGLCSAVVTYVPPVGTDNCAGATTTQTAGLASGATYPVGVTTNTFKVTDAAGLMTTCSFTVTVNDTQFPVIACPSNIVKPNDVGICGAIVTFTAPTGTDNCPGAVTIRTTGLASGSTFPVGVTTNTYQVTDASGNVTTCSFTITVNDTEFPAITCPANIVKSNDAGLCSALVVYTAPVGTDNCPGSVTVQTAGLASNTYFPLGVTTNTFKVTDASGNVTTCSFTVTVNDTEFPVISCPNNIVISTDAGLCSALVTYSTPTGTDNCPGAVTTQTSGLASGSAFPKGITTNTFKVTDGAGNSTTCSFTVTVNDTELPVIACPSNIVQSTDAGICSAVVTYATPVGTDNCPGAVTVQTAGLPSGAMFPKGITTNTFKVTDAMGNTSTCSFTVTINDTEFPVISCPSNIVQSNDVGFCSAAVTYTAPVGTDNCPGSVTVQIAGLPSGSNFPIGVTTNTFKVTDASGNVTTCSFTVTVNDTQFPVINCPADIVKPNDANLCSALVTYTPPVGTDNCPGSVTVQIAGQPSGTYFPVGVTTNTFKVTDASGNVTTCSFTVTVNDTQFPVITCPGNITMGTDPGMCSAVVTFAATATDNCPGTVITYSKNPGTVFSIGSTIVTAYATDAAGNSSQCTFFVTVVDTEKPVVTCIGNLSKGTDAPTCTYTAVGTVLDPASMSDNCGITMTTYTLTGVTTGTGMNTLAGVVFNKGITNIKWKVKDAAGNADSCTFILTVVDDDAPTVSCVGNQSRGTDATACSYTTVGTEFNPTASNDNCGITATTYALSGVTSGSGSNTLAGVAFNKGVTTVIWQVTDAAGNTGTCSFTVTVIDNDAPVIVCKANQNRGTVAPTCTYTTIGTEFDLTSSTDNCGVVSTTYSMTGATGGSGSNTLAGFVFNKGITMVTWLVTDAAGNSATCKFNVKVVDDDAPTIVCKTNQSRGTSAPLCNYTTVGTEFDLMSSSDNCGVISTTTYTLTGATSGSGSNSLATFVFVKGVTTIKWTVTDPAGNTSTCSFTVTIADDDAPSLVCKANQTRGTTTPACKYTAVGTEFNLMSSSDNCGVTSTTYTLSGATTGTGSSSLAGKIFNTGVTTIVWKVSDAAGNMNTCSFTVTVNDNILPTLTCKANQVRNAAAYACKYTTVGTEFNLTASSDNCGITSTTYTLTGVTTGTGSTTLAGVMFNKGVSTVTWKVTDAAGNSKTCSFTVTVNDVDSDCDGVFDCTDVCPGGDDTVDNDGNSLPDCKYPPSYAQIIPAWKCGANKVYICHSGSTQCVNYSLLAGHIGHGDYLGPCDNANCNGWSLISESDTDIYSEAELEKDHVHELALPNVMEVYPNPARNKMFVKLPNHGLAPVHIQVYNSMGKQMFNDIFDLKTEHVIIPINVLEFPSGLYYIKATVDGVEQVKTVSINK